MIVNLGLALWRMLAVRIIWRNGSVGYAIDMLATAAAALAVVSLGTGMVFAHAVLAGFALWQIFEWAAHRYLLHGLIRGQHWLHHRAPDGDAGVPPFVTIPLLLMALWAAVALIGDVAGRGVFCGFALGYLSYNLTHWAIHTGRWPRRGILGGVARRHDLHHRGVAANFNVLLPFADMAFGTYAAAN